MQYAYSWNQATPVSGFKDIDPEAFAQELERLEKVHGAITSDLLTDAAKVLDHPAHNFIYHCGQRKAARLHYEQRAGLLLRSLQVTVVEEPTRTIRARLAMPATDDDGGEGRDRFLSAQEVSTRPDLRDLHRMSLLRRMNLMRQELINFDEFAAVVVAIEKVLKREDRAA